MFRIETLSDVPNEKKSMGLSEYTGPFPSFNLTPPPKPLLRSLITDFVMSEVSRKLRMVGVGSQNLSPICGE